MTDSFDLIVLGAGSGGLATAFRAARHGARVALVESGPLGGTCVNVGCVPKKAMWYAAEAAEALHTAIAYGFDVQPGALDWRKFVALRTAYIERIHASYRKRLAEHDIKVIAGHGRVSGPGRVDVAGASLQSAHVLIATGAHSRRLDVPGFELGIDSDGFFALEACPRRVAVVGSGYIGVELAGVLRALGAEVDLFARSRLLRGFDQEITEALTETMRASGVGMRLGCAIDAAHRSGEALQLACSDGESHGPYDVLLWAVGRVPNSKNIGLQECGVACDDKGHVVVDQGQDTNVEGIHAIGDVTSRPALTPVAIAAGRQLAERLFAGKADARMNYDNIPTVVFSHPPLGSVGLSEAEARQAHGDGAVRVYRSRFKPMQDSLAGRAEMSLFKLVCVGDEERVVGLHAFGPGADEMLQGFAVAIKMGARKRDFDETVAIHPTSAEELVLMERPQGATA